MYFSYFTGILLHPCITLEDVMGLSALNTFKSALLSIPFGGSQGAIRVDPEDYTDNDIQKITRRYIVELLKKNVIGYSLFIFIFHCIACQQCLF